MKLEVLYIQPTNFKETRFQSGWLNFENLQS